MTTLWFSTKIYAVKNKPWKFSLKLPFWEFFSLLTKSKYFLGSGHTSFSIFLFCFFSWATENLSPPIFWRVFDHVTLAQPGARNCACVMWSREQNIQRIYDDVINYLPKYEIFFHVGLDLDLPTNSYFLLWVKLLDHNYLNLSHTREKKKPK